MTQNSEHKHLPICLQVIVFARFFVLLISLFLLKAHAASNITVQGILKNASNQSFDFSPSSPSGITVQFRHISPSDPAPGSVFDTISDYPMTIKKGHFAVTIPIQDATRTQMSEDPVGWYVEIIGNLHPDQVVAATYRLPINELPIASVAKALAKDSLQNDMIADGSITASKLATGTINSSSMAASAVATTNIADSAVTAAKLATGSVTNTHFSTQVADRLAVSKLAQGGATNDQVLSWNNSTSQWAPKTVSAGGSGTVTSITAGTGLTGGTITASGTVAVDVGTVSGKIPQLGAGGKLTASTLPVATVSNAGAIRATAGKITVDANGDITNITADSAATATSAATAADADAVGGVDGADVATAVSAITDATSANTASKIVKRDASGNFNAGTISANLTGNVTGSLTGAASLNVLKAGDTMTGALTLNPSSGTDALSIKKGLNFRLFNAGDTASIAFKAPAALASDYTLTLPLNAGSNGQVLTSDGSGNLSWQTGAASGVASVNGETGTVTLDSDDIAQGSTNRYFSDTLARGALSASAPLTYNSGTGAFSIADAAIGDAKLATGISASKISGTLGSGNIPNLDAAKITSGTFDAARLPAATSSAKGAIIATAGKITVDSNGDITNITADSAATATTADYATLAADTENVGAKTAAEVVTAVSDVQSAASANTASTIVKRDASGNFAAGTISANLSGNVTGSVTGAASNNVLKAGDTMTGILNLNPSAGAFALVVHNGKQLSFFDGTDGETISLRAPNLLAASSTLTLPEGTGSAGQFLKTDGTGVLSWDTVSPGGSGTVTSVGLTMPSIFSVASSPITSSGTLGVTLQNQSGNVIFASPANGSSGAPTFRLLDAADIPSLAASKITSGTFDAARLPAATSSAKGAIIATAGKISVDSNGDITNITADSAATATTADYATLAADTENVGAKTAAEVVSAVSTVQAATNSNSADTLVLRDSNGDFAANEITANSFVGTATGNLSKSGDDTMAGILTIDLPGGQGYNSSLWIRNGYGIALYTPDNSKGTVLRASPSVSASYQFYFPTSGGTSGYVLTTDGAGVTSWTNSTTSARNSISGTSPISYNSTTGALSIANESIDTVHIEDDAIVDDKLATSAVTTNKIADSAVTDAKISAVAATKLTGTIDAARLPAATSSAKGAIKATTGKITVDSNGDITNIAADTAATLSGTVATANGGTGQTSYTDGQLLIGNTTGNTLAKGTLTAGNGVTITNGAGSITIANPLTPLGGRKNLMITTHATNPNYQLSITADYVTLLDTSNAMVLASTVSLTADITASGANGLDTGTEAISTWYYVWIVSNGTTTASLLSTSATAPTMPSGYTYKTRVGAVYNQSDGNFQRFIQYDRKVYLETAPTALSAGSLTAWTAVSLATYIPPNATRALFGIYCAKNNNDGVSVNCRVGFVSGSIFHAMTTNNNGTYAMNTRAQFEIPIKTAQTIYYSTSAASGDLTLYPEGFELPD